MTVYRSVIEVGKDGKIAYVCEGYGETQLKELNCRMAAAVPSRLDTRVAKA